MNVRIRRANAADIPAMMNLEQQSPAAGHWSRQQYESFFVTPSRPQQSERLTWIVENDAEAHEFIGFLVAHRIDADWELENMVVASKARRRGVGARLLGELLAQARSAHAREIFLEVRESNHNARALYRKLGFEETGLRKGYYSDPPEDAILCCLRLC
jgi:[ribosomal protein S18]-alanine N-acetyltransferase